MTDGTTKAAGGEGAGNPASARRMLATGAKLLLGIGILWHVLRGVGWHELAEGFSGLSLPLFCVLVFFSVCDRFLMGYKWNLLLRANGIRITNRRAFSLYIVSNLLGSVTPGNLGGDAFRITVLSRSNRCETVLSTVILERVIGGLTLLFFVTGTLPFALPLLGAEAGRGAIVMVVAVLLALFLVLLFLPARPFVRDRVDRFLSVRTGRVSGKIHRYFSVYADQCRHRRALSLFFALTLAETALLFLIDYFTAKTARADVSPAFIFLVMPAVHFILRMPFTIEGIGVQEGLWAFSLGLTGVPVAQGVVVSLVGRLKNLLAVYIPGFLVFLFSGNGGRKRGAFLQRS